MSRVHAVTPTGSLQEPAVRIVDMTLQNKGFGLVATQRIRKGDVIITEKAAVASQLPVPQGEGQTSTSNGHSNDWKNTLFSVRACQQCFRSLEPISALGSLSTTQTPTEIPLPECWPIAEYGTSIIHCDDNGDGDNYDETTKPLAKYTVDSMSGRVQCHNCRALFCHKFCRQQHLNVYGSCCDCTNAVRAVVGDPQQEVSEPLVLASRIFVRLLHQYRSSAPPTNDSNKATLNSGETWRLGTFLQGLCGDSSDIDALEIGQPVVPDNQNNDNFQQQHTSYSVKPLFEKLCKLLQISEAEQSTLSLEHFQQVSAIVARNTHCVTTQNPFRQYYNALLRKAGGRGTDRHQELARQVAKALGSSDGTMQRSMDNDVAEKCAVQIMALFALTARCNHSCDPNAEVRSEEYMDNVIDLVAKRDIQMGEEITISYINLRDSRSGSHLPYHKRQRELHAKYMFRCTCQRCIEEGPPMPAAQDIKRTDTNQQRSALRRRRARILFGVTGSVAAVKAPEIAVRLSRELKADVRVLLSRGGRNFWDKAGDYNANFWSIVQQKIETSKSVALEVTEQSNNTEDDGLIHLHGRFLCDSFSAPAFEQNRKLLLIRLPCASHRLIFRCG